MSRPVTEAALIDWRNNEFLQDDLFCHFENRDQWDWTEIKGEWLRLNNLMFGDNVQVDSPIEELACAAICQGFHGAIASVAAALGVKAGTLQMVVADWTEAKASGEVPAPIGFSGLEKSRAEWEVELRARIQRKAQ